MYKFARMKRNMNEKGNKKDSKKICYFPWSLEKNFLNQKNLKKKNNEENRCLQF